MICAIFRLRITEIYLAVFIKSLKGEGEITMTDSKKQFRTEHVFLLMRQDLISVFCHDHLHFRLS